MGERIWVLRDAAGEIVGASAHSVNACLSDASNSERVDARMREDIIAIYHALELNQNVPRGYTLDRVEVA